MREDVKNVAMEAKGFLSEAEGMCLFTLAAESSSRAPCLEIGTYCGKSTLFLAEGCRVAGRHPLFTIDHHRGSEEQQPGQLYFDPDLFDVETGSFTTLTHLMVNVRTTGLADCVIPIVTDSKIMSRYWPGTGLSLLFIDGGHAEADVTADYEGWSPHVIPAGYLCVHDIFPNPADGGQAPYHMFERARASGRWIYVDQIETLGIMRRR